jgi:hypothetical protein
MAPRPDSSLPETSARMNAQAPESLYERARVPCTQTEELGAIAPTALRRKAG